MASTRIERALSERIYLLHAEQFPDKWEFRVRGQSSNVYEQELSSSTFSCSCPDYGKRHSFCKHLLYLICRIGVQMDIGMKVSTRSTNWNNERYQACSRSWYNRLSSRITESAPETTHVREPEGDCPICFEALGTDHLAECKTTCHNWFHKDCIQAWINNGHETCPTCRAPWETTVDIEEEPILITGRVLAETATATATTDSTTAAVADAETSAAAAASAGAAETITPPPREMKPDILFTFDTTGSMYPCISEVKRYISDISQKLFSEIPNLRIAVMAHGDYCDKNTRYLTKHIDFTNNVEEIKNFVVNVEGTYGGDYPEAYEYVLRESRSLSWRMDANVKSLVMIGDAPPHEKNENPEKIDWFEEAERLRDRNVQIFSVQCLNHGNRDSFHFYSQIAAVTNGYHLFLDQFSYIKDMIQAICYRQYDTTQLENFEQEMQSRSGGITSSMRLMFDTMLGRKTREQVTAEMSPDRFRSSYSSRYSPSVTSSDTETPLVEGTEEDLRPCPPTKFQVFNVERDMGIKEFCDSMGIRFQKGKGFYEFTKSEIVQPQKEIVLMKRDTGDLYEGDVARYLAGIPRNSARSRISPSSVEGYRVFIQSTSPNRKLIGGQGFLYEVSYD